MSEGARLLLDLFTSMEAGVYATDATGAVVVVNPAALRLLGREREDLVGRSMHALSHHSSLDGRPLPVESCALLSVITTGLPARSDDDTFWRADGTALPVSWVSAPVLHDGQVAGAVVVFNDATIRHVEVERHEARQRANALARERLVEQNERLELLGRVGEAVSTLDTVEALRRLARLSVGRVADWCVVDAAEAGRVERVALASRDPDRFPELRVTRPLPPPTATATGALARALTTGGQQVHSCAESSGTSDDPLDLEQARLLAELGCAYALVTPLTVRRQVLGAMTWGRLDPDRPFQPEDRALAAEVGRRAGLALENARLFGQQRRVAEALQRSLLTVLPQPDHLHITARYLPATEGAQVGGDWYDAFVLPGGATSIVIGDILGHDLAAAAQMGQVRNMLRSISADRLEPPSGVLARLDRGLRDLRVEALATCLLGRIEQPPQLRGSGRRLLRWSSAGHLPPVVVAADGRVRLLDEPGDLMLGVEPDLPRSDSVTVLEPGDTVWLCTDGLVERSDQSLDQGLARLRRALTSLHRLPLDEACDRLLERMLPFGHPDDVAVLAVRAHPEDRPRPAEAGPGHGGLGRRQAGDG